MESFFYIKLRIGIKCKSMTLITSYSLTFLSISLAIILFISQNDSIPLVISSLNPHCYIKPTSKALDITGSIKA